MSVPSVGIEEQDLPGIGRRYTLTTPDGGQFCVVLHHSGRRDLYVSAEDDDEPTVLSLEDDDARRMGAILAGAFFTPAAVRQVEAVIGGLLIDWVTVREGSSLVDQSIAAARVRQRTGITIAAIVRDGESLIAPEPTEVIRTGDRLVVVGRPDDLPRFVDDLIR